jgi:hypothetical protein
MEKGSVLNQRVQDKKQKYTDVSTPQLFKAAVYLAGLEFSQRLQAYIITLKNQQGVTVVKKSASDVSKDSKLVEKLSAMDANRVGYMAGINDTLKESALLKS